MKTRQHRHWTLAAIAVAGCLAGASARLAAQNRPVGMMQPLPPDGGRCWPGLKRL